MEDQDDENNQMKESPEPLYEFYWDNDTSGEIWPCSHGSYEVSVTCVARRAKWWQRLRSDLPFPRGKRKDIVDALKYAQTWISRRENQALSPLYAELKVYLGGSH